MVHSCDSFASGEIVALKKLKMEKEKEGFPITSLREINMLLKGKHPNVVFVKVSISSLTHTHSLTLSLSPTGASGGQQYGQDLYCHGLCGT